MQRAIFMSLVLVVALSANAQLDSTFSVDRKPLIKVGGFIYPDSSRYGGFSLHLELERTFRRAQYLSGGVRLDYLNFEDFFDKNIFIGYQLKFYPFYWKSKKPYQGFFIGVDPLYLVQKGNDYSRYGPGLGALIGYQHIIKNKFSVGIEPGGAYIIDLNGDSPQNNPDNEYFYFFIALKFGIKL